MSQKSPHDAYQLLLAVFKQVEMRNPERRRHTWLERGSAGSDDFLQSKVGRQLSLSMGRPPPTRSLKTAKSTKPQPSMKVAFASTVFAVKLRNEAAKTKQQQGFARNASRRKLMAVMDAKERLTNRDNSMINLARGVSITDLASTAPKTLEAITERAAEIAVTERTAQDAPTELVVEDIQDEGIGIGAGPESLPAGHQRGSVPESATTKATVPTLLRACTDTSLRSRLRRHTHEATSHPLEGTPRNSCRPTSASDQRPQDLASSHTNDGSSSPPVRKRWRRISHEKRERRESNEKRESLPQRKFSHDHHRREYKVLDAEFMSGADYKVPLTPAQLLHYKLIFDLNDADGDGKVDVSDLASFLDSLGHGVPTDELEEMIDSMGIKEVEGKVTESDFLEFMRRTTVADIPKSKLPRIHDILVAEMGGNSHSPLSARVSRELVSPDLESGELRDTGLLTKTQCANVLELLGFQLDALSLSDLFDELDTDCDGKMSEAELITCIGIIKCNLLEVMQLAQSFMSFRERVNSSRRASGRLSEHEVTAKPGIEHSVHASDLVAALGISEEEADEMIFIADMKETQQIDFTEFRQVVCNWSGCRS